MKNNIIFLLLCLFTLQAYGQLNTFTGSVNNLWTEPGNWDLGHVPTMSEQVGITNKTCVIPANAGDLYAASIDCEHSFFTIGSNSTLHVGGDPTPGVNGIRVLGSTTVVDVYGTINISNTQARGILNWALINIYGTVNITGEGTTSILNIGYSSTVNIEENGILKIQGNNMSSGYGGYSGGPSSTLINRGQIEISDTQGNHFFNNLGDVDNYGLLSVVSQSDGQLYSYTALSGYTKNHLCGEIRIEGAKLQGDWSNMGYIYFDHNALSFITSFTNEGFIEDVQGAFDLPDTILINPGYLIQPLADTVNVGQIIAPVFYGNGTNLSIVGNQFYTDSTLTVAAGSFDSLAVSWTPNANAEGLSKFYFRVNTSDCQRVMSIMTGVPVENNPVIATYCEFSNGKTTELEVEGNGCVDGVINVSQAFKLSPQTSPPANPSMGYLYLDGNINRLKYWNGGTWVIVQ